MKLIIVNYYLFIDVITNSSTEIFINTHDKTIQLSKELIDTLLKVAGSDKKADDLFTFKTEIRLTNEDGDEKWVEDTEDREDEEGWDIEDGDSGYSTGRLIITSKEDDKLSIDLTEKLESIFSINGAYC